MQDLSEPFIRQIYIRNLQRWSLASGKSQISIQRPAGDWLADPEQEHLPAVNALAACQASTVRKARSGVGVGARASKRANSAGILHNALVNGPSPFFSSRVIYIGFH